MDSWSQGRTWVRVHNQEPNFGAPDGWGMMQLDGARGTPITTQEAWNWKVNVLGGIRELNTKRGYFNAYLNKIRSVYQAHDPSIWEEPPEYWNAPGSQSIVLNKEEICTIQMYNGGAIIWIYSDVNGQLHYYATCLEFNSSNPPGQKWSFVPNTNHYVEHVIQRYETAPY